MTTITTMLVALLAFAGGAKVKPRGAGTTSAFPLYSKWISKYRKATKIRVDYRAVGSREGMRRITKGSVDFGAMQAPISDEEAKQVPGGLVHVPVAIAAMTFVYNVEGLKTGLRLTPDIVADIFLGKITMWNDRRIKRLNRRRRLPKQKITVIYGSGGGTYVVSDYLSKVSKEFEEKVGKGTKPKWPVGEHRQGADKIVSLLKETPGSFSYLDAAYQNWHKLPYAELRNRAARWVKPTEAAMTAAAEHALKANPPDLRISMVNMEGKASYPLTSFTFAVLHKEPKEESRARAVVEFLWWAVHEGQKYNAVLHYTPLPASVVKRCEAALGSIKGGGR